MLAVLLVPACWAVYAGHEWVEASQQATSVLLAAAGTKATDIDHVPCKGLAPRPFVVLALGQSNAGNHGEIDQEPSRVRVFHASRCLEATDPLPGSTGQGGSIWSLLPAALSTSMARGRPTLISAIGLDASPISAWVNWRSPIRHHLTRHVTSMIEAGLNPDAVLWQQGEADARIGTQPADYAASLLKLSDILRQAGYEGRLFLAHSTICRSSPDAGLRAAVDDLVARYPRHFAQGADTDALAGPTWRHDGCHLSAAGRRQAAQLWAQRLAAVAAP